MGFSTTLQDSENDECKKHEEQHERSVFADLENTPLHLLSARDHFQPHKVGTKIKWSFAAGSTQAARSEFSVEIDEKTRKSRGANGAKPAWSALQSPQARIPRRVAHLKAAVPAICNMEQKAQPLAAPQLQEERISQP
jgi:hypothetical protein